MGLANVEAGTKVGEDARRQPFREDVRELGACGRMKDPDLAQCNALPYKVEIDLNVLRTLVLHWVAGHVDGADVVAVDHGSL